MRFSPRLRAIYDELLPGLPVADLCCDHGYLGLNAYLSQHFPEIHFVDQVPQTMMVLENNFNQYFKNTLNLTQVNFTTSDAGKIQSILTGNVVIAGVGGKNMMRILDYLNQFQILRPKRLILSPHRHQELFEQSELFGLSHSHTRSVIEAGITRPIFVFHDTMTS